MPRDVSSLIPEQIAAAAALREARLASGSSVAELAEKLGTNRVTVFGWETGRRSPPLWMIGPIAAAIGISAGELAEKISAKIRKSTRK